MLGIVDWLCSIEEKVGELYRQAAAQFAEDGDLAALLGTLADQEQRHAQWLREAFMAGDPFQERLLTTVIDGETRSQVEAALEDTAQKVAAGQLSREAMAVLIVDTEYYEWNSIFLYAMHVMQGRGAQFAAAQAEIELHLQTVENYLNSFPFGRQLLQRIENLPRLDRLRVLVVEDDPMLACLVKNVLVKEAEVVIAENGRQGLELLMAKAFDVIVSDVEMPEMDGLEMYRQALRLGTARQERFIFLTACQKPECLQFLAEQKLTVLRKPSPIHRIRQAVLGASASRRRL